MEIHKIAKELSLSRSAITQILSGKDGSDPDYRKIIETIKALGMIYEQGMSLNYVHRSKTIGVVMRDLTETFYKPFIKAIEQTADSLGYGVLFVKKHNASRQSIDYIKLLDEKVDGFIFLGEETSRSQEVFNLQENKVPIVIIQGQKTYPDVTVLSVDNEKAAFHAVSHLAKLGHKRIIHVGGPMSYYETVERQRGYEQAVKVHGLPYKQVLHTELIYEETYDIGCRLAKVIETERITAAFCFNDMIATGIVDGLMDQGYVVPKDFSVIGFDDLCYRHLSMNWVPRISSIRQPQKDMAVYAVSNLVKMMEENAYDASKTFECTYVERDSVRYL